MQGVIWLFILVGESENKRNLNKKGQKVKIALTLEFCYHALFWD